MPALFLFLAKPFMALLALICNATVMPSCGWSCLCFFISQVWRGSGNARK